MVNLNSTYCHKMVRLFSRWFQWSFSFVVLGIEARASGILASAVPWSFILQPLDFLRKEMWFLETCYWTLGPGNQSEVLRFGGGHLNPLSHAANPPVLFLTALLPLDVTRLKQLATEVSAPCAQCFQRLLLRREAPKHLGFFENQVTAHFKCTLVGKIYMFCDILAICTSFF